MNGDGAQGKTTMRYSVKLTSKGQEWCLDLKHVGKSPCLLADGVFFHDLWSVATHRVVLVWEVTFPHHFHHLYGA